MDIGITTFAGEYGMEPPALGRAVEERGFESLFFPEHTHIPVHSRRGDGSSIRGYAETYDPFVALSAIAPPTPAAALPVTVFNTPPDKRLLDALAGADIDRCLLLLPAGTESELLTTLDEWTALAAGR